MENILKIENIEKYYGSKSSLTKAIDNISFEVEKGEFVAIMGSSGSGKTTLLNCISTIDKVTAGHIFVGGTDITKLKGNDLNKFRREDLESSKRTRYRISIKKISLPNEWRTKTKSSSSSCHNNKS